MGDVGEWRAWLLALPLVWLLQFLFSYPQAVHVHREWTNMRRQGAVGVGRKRSWLGGAVVLVAVDARSRIVEARVLAGRSVFARFRPLPGVVGRSLQEVEPDPRWPRVVQEAFVAARDHVYAASAAEKLGGEEGGEQTARERSSVRGSLTEGR